VILRVVVVAAAILAAVAIHNLIAVSRWRR
jgi:hypothetical protein